LAAVGQLALRLSIDGIVATNTTTSRSENDQGSEVDRALSSEQGGLSGVPLRELSLRAIRILKAASLGQVAIIGVGGIASSADALLIRDAGADLVQFYTGHLSWPCARE